MMNIYLVCFSHGGCHRKHRMAEQYFREFVGSDIEPRSDSDYFIDLTHVLTVTRRLRKSYTG